MSDGSGLLVITNLKKTLRTQPGDGRSRLRLFCHPSARLSLLSVGSTVSYKMHPVMRT